MLHMQKAKAQRLEVAIASTCALLSARTCRGRRIRIHPNLPQRGGQAFIPCAGRIQPRSIRRLAVTGKSRTDPSFCNPRHPPYELLLTTISIGECHICQLHHVNAVTASTSTGLKLQSHTYTCINGVSWIKTRWMSGSLVQGLPRGLARLFSVTARSARLGWTDL